MKRTVVFYLFFAILTLATGCIEEDLSRCPTGIRVYFSYDFDASGNDIRPEELEKLNLYIFDRKTGTLKATVEDLNPLRSPDHFITVDSLPVGEYNMVVWAGSAEGYTVQNINNYEQATIALNHGLEVAKPIGQLFFASLVQTEVTGARGQRFHLPLVRNTNTINLTTEGLVSNGDTYRLNIIDTNGKYNFDNSFAPDSEFTYTTLCEKNPQGQPLASLRVLRLAPGRKVMIELINVTTGSRRYSGNLIDLLNARGVDYNLQHKFDVHLTFNADLSVDVTVDQWQLTEGGILLK